MTTMHSSPDPLLVKIKFIVDPSEWHGSAAETLWAERIDERRFRLRNVPFFACGVSNEDIVLARRRRELLVFEGVDSRGGHSTYRILPIRRAARRQIDILWGRLEEIGCSYEEGPSRLRAVDVPPQADIFEVYRRLEAGEDAKCWSFEEGHCGHPVERLRNRKKR